MRLQRLLAGVLTIALLGLTPLLVSAPASAAKTKRDIGVSVKQGNGKVVFKGKFKPGKKTRYTIQRRLNDKGGWKNFKKLRTNAKSKYSFRAPGPKKVGDSFCYRIVVAKNKKFKRTVAKKITTGSFKGARMCVETRFV